MKGSQLGRSFWTLWSAFTAANLGDGLSLVAFPLLAITLTGDARLVALVSAFRFLPFVLIGLPAGVVIDRVDRRTLAVYAQFGRAATMSAVALALFADLMSIGVLAGAAFVVGSGEVLTDGGLPALVRNLVAASNLEIANSRLSASQTVANLFVGPPLGAALFEASDAAPFIGAAILYIGALVQLTHLPGSFTPVVESTAGSLQHQLTRGLSFVWNHPVLRPLALTVAVFSFVGEAGNAVFVILVTERLGFTGLGFGVLLSLDAAASLVMSFYVAGLVRRTSHAVSMKLSVIAFSMSTLLLGLTTTVTGIVIAVLLGGVSDPTWNVVSTTIRQRLVPDEIFGRMMTAYLFIAWGMQPFGAVFGGVLAERFGPEWVYVISGTVVGSLIVVARPLFRQIDLSLATPTVAEG